MSTRHGIRYYEEPEAYTWPQGSTEQNDRCDRLGSFLLKVVTCYWIYEALFICCLGDELRSYGNLGQPAPESGNNR